MRKITSDAVEAFVNGEEFRRDNTKVHSGLSNSIMYLHGHMIASKEGNTVKIKDAGRQTKTTKERLNGILDAYHGDSYIFQKDYQWYLSRHGEVEEFLSSKWIEI